MRLRKVLHPEIVLNRRGGDQLERDFYQKILKEVVILPKGFACTGTAELVDPNYRSLFCLAKRYTVERPKNYFIPKDFSEALARIDREIPIDRLPDRWFGYFQFAEGAVWDDEEPIVGAYVFLGPAEETCVESAYYGKKALWISYVNEMPPQGIQRRREFAAESKGEDDAIMLMQNPHDGHGHLYGLPACARLLIVLDEEQAKGTLTKMLEGVPTTDVGLITGDGRVESIYSPKESDIAKRNIVFRILVNAVLYINSVDPDLINAPTTGHLSDTKKKQLEQSSKPVNECTLPVTVVSYSYHRERYFTVDETWVDTFPRWQRCGPGFTQVKLIWVKPHKRVYKKDESGNDSGELH